MSTNVYDRFVFTEKVAVSLMLWCPEGFLVTINLNNVIFLTIFLPLKLRPVNLVQLLKFSNPSCFSVENSILTTSPQCQEITVIIVASVMGVVSAQYIQKRRLATLFINGSD
jgi:hypothetical protein